MASPYGRRRHHFKQISQQTDEYDLALVSPRRKVAETEAEEGSNHVVEVVECDAFYFPPLPPVEQNLCEFKA